MYIYHYCSVETLKSILENKSIWLSDLCMSNDIEEDCLLSKALYLHGKKLNMPNVHRHYLDEARKATSIFGICFSKNRDDFVLWSLYSNKTGVCLAFDCDKITEYFKDNLENENNNFRAFFVKYVDADKDCKEIIPKEKITWEKQELYNDLSCKFKSRHWEYENEYRMVFRCYTKDVTGKKVSYKFLFGGQEIELKCNNENVQRKAHFEIPLDIDLIEEIIIGPYSEYTKHDIRKLLITTNEYSALDHIKILDSLQTPEIKIGIDKKIIINLLLDDLKNEIIFMTLENQTYNKNDLQKICEKTIKTISGLYHYLDDEKEKKHVLKIVRKKLLFTFKSNIARCDYKSDILNGIDELRGVFNVNIEKLESLQQLLEKKKEEN